MFVPLGLASWFFRILHILTGHEPTREHGYHRISLDPHIIRSIKPEDVAIEIVRACVNKAKYDRPGVQQEVVLPPILQPRRGTELCSRYDEFPGLLERALCQEDNGRFKFISASSDVVAFERI